MYVITETPIEGGEYPALSDIAPAAFVEECEIYEQFGIRPATGKPLNRIMLPAARRPAHSRPQARQAAGRGPRARTPWRAGVRVPVRPGPPGRRRVALLRPGHQRRGSRRPVPVHLAQAPRPGMAAAGQDPGAGAVPRRARRRAQRGRHGWAFAAAAEAATGVEPAKAAQRTRAVALELERLYNHAAAMAALCQSTGLSVGQSAAEIALERLLRLNARAFGHRYLFGVIGIGGASRAPDAGRDPRESFPAPTASSSAPPTPCWAPTPSSTGWRRPDPDRRARPGPRPGRPGRPRRRARGDARLVPGGPYGQYRQRGRRRTATAGDVLARFTVMLAEAAESVRLIGQFLDAGTAAGTDPAVPRRADRARAPGSAGPSLPGRGTRLGRARTTAAGSAGPGCARRRRGTGAASTTPAGRRTCSPTSRSSRPASG